MPSTPDKWGSLISEAFLDRPLLVPFRLEYETPCLTAARSGAFFYLYIH